MSKATASEKTENKAPSAKDALAGVRATFGKGGLTKMERIEKMFGELKAGEYVSTKKDGTEVTKNLSAPAQLTRVVKLVKAGTEVPPEVAKRFDWSQARDSIEEYAIAKDVPVSSVFKALGIAEKANGAKPVARKSASAN